MRNIILTFCCVVLLSCSIKKNVSLIYDGEDYKKIYNDSLKHSLRLFKNQTFIYSITGGYVAHTNSKCSGTWLLKNNIINLKCEDEKLLNQLSTGYMNQRDYRLKVIDDKSLLMVKENIVLSK